MKMLAGLVLSVSAVFVVNSAALASGFNDRGMYFPATVDTGSTAAVASVGATPSGFKDRGQNFTAQAPTGSEKPRMSVYITANGFNDRDHGYTGSWMDTLKGRDTDS